jgi:hypothetical protein
MGQDNGGMAKYPSAKAWIVIRSVTHCGGYDAGSIVTSLWTARRDWKTLPLLPLAFSILHLSYGLGFLWGLWKWRNKWSEPSGPSFHTERTSSTSTPSD